MKKPVTTLLIGLGVVFAAAASLTAYVMYIGGVFRSVEHRFAGTCAPIAIGGGSEDMEIDRERGLAYLSVVDRTGLAHGDAADGTVMLLDLNVPEPAPRAALAYDPKDFRPSGISLFKSPDAPSRLFAISNHDDGSASVEIAEESPAGGFFPKETIRDTEFVHPKALVATGARQFYLVNDLGAGEGPAVRLDLLSKMGHSTLIYYDGQKARVLERGLHRASGIALSRDGRRLYVSEMLNDALRIFRRDPATGALTFVESLPLRSAPDNLDVDGEDRVSIAAHPKLLQYFSHLGGSGKGAPTQIFGFDPDATEPRLFTVYQDPGAEISDGSVAAHWRDELLVGASLDQKVLLCKMKK